MKTTTIDYAEIIEYKRSAVVKALKRAVNLAKRNGNTCNVLLCPNGTLHIMEDVSHGNEWYEGEYCFIAQFSSPKKHYNTTDFEKMVDRVIRREKDSAEWEAHMEREAEKAYQECLKRLEG